LGCAIALAAVLINEESAGLAILGMYCIPSNSVAPLPHEPAILFFADFYRPIWITIAATAGSGIAAFSDYAIVRGALRHEWVARISRGRWFRWAVGSFMKRPFATVVLFAISPLPVSVVRVLAPASNFSVWRYVAAMMLGRFPRFYAFAWIGFLVPIPTWVLAIAVIAPLVMMVLAHRSGEDAPIGEAASVLESIDITGEGAELPKDASSVASVDAPR
tara:strand:- start:44097 stop:44750 length:654 start_codon:yes stop_codon:yes gene_type:complete